jgi:large conductance mechanosensitive channel
LKEEWVLKDFKAFVMRGNVLDLAVAVIIGAAFGKIVSSLVDDILMPPLGMLLGHLDFSNFFLDLSGKHYATLAEAKAAGAPAIRYGLFLNALLTFLIQAFAIFMLVRQLGRFMTKKEAAAPAEKDCPFCLLKIPVKASKCGHCTSMLAG